ncbi:MAG: hypothetical protein LKF52_14050 [Butyrivibrio sp.]|jgi:hypothetical protein|nr:hypothetical protein [Butyrivibrio sp.]
MCDLLKRQFGENIVFHGSPVYANILVPHQAYDTGFEAGRMEEINPSEIITINVDDYLFMAEYKGKVE